MASISTDAIGGGDGYGFGGGYGGYGLWIFAIIFLFVIFVIFFRHDRHEDGGLKEMLPLLAGGALANKKQGCEATCQDTSRLWHDIAEEAGKTRHDLDVTARQVQQSISEQTCAIRDKLGMVVENQNRLAWDAERQQNARWESEMRDRLAERDRLLIEKNAQLLAQENINNTNSKFCILQNELAVIRDKMLKAPQYIPFGGVAASNPCVPNLAYA